jgi:hypothetical protein
MALELRFNIEFGKDSLIVYDTTCTYESCSNETGYNSPNEVASTATAATLEITVPGTDATQLIDLYPYLPNDDGTGYEIFFEDLSLPEAPVGEWNFTYEVVFPGNTYSKSCMFLNTCPVDHCLAERVKKIDPACGGIYDKFTNRMILMAEGAISNHACCNYDIADEIIKKVYKMCTGNNCEETCSCEC